MKNDLFLHGSMQVVTSDKIKKVKDITEMDDIVAIDRLGYVTYVKPSIMKSKRHGVYYTIETDLMDIKLSTKKSLYLLDKEFYKVNAFDITNSLIGSKVSLPVSSHEHKRIGLKYSMNEIMLYSLSKLKRTNYVDGKMRIATRKNDNVEFLDKLFVAMNIEYTKKVLSKTTVFLADYIPKGGKYISKYFAETLNAEQAARVMEVSMKFDTTHSALYKKGYGQMVLCELFNATKLIMIAMKAGYRCYLEDRFKYDSGIDSITISKAKSWDVTIKSSKLAQNTTVDKMMYLTREYNGFLCIYNGCVFIMPNEDWR